MIDTAEQTTCKDCGKPIMLPEKRGPHPRVFCNGTCRKRWQRRQKEQPTRSNATMDTIDAQARIAELEQDLARYRQIVDLSDRQQMEIQFMQCGERIGYQPLLSLSIKSGFHYWQTFMDGASDEELASAIVVAQHIWKRGEDLKTIRQIEQQEKIITDLKLERNALRQQLEECNRDTNPPGGKVNG